MPYAWMRDKLVFRGKVVMKLAYSCQECSSIVVLRYGEVNMAWLANIPLRNVLLVRSRVAHQPACKTLAANYAVTVGRRAPSDHRVEEHYSNS